MKQLTDNIFIFLGDSLGDGSNCNSYFVKSKDEILIIDSGFGKYSINRNVSVRDPLEVFLNIFKSNLKSVKALTITHAHIDHIGGIASLPDNLTNQVQVMAHKYEKPHLENGDLTYIDPITQMEGPKISIDKSLSDGEIITVGDLNFEIIHTSGHTEGSLCLYERDKQWLFSGDTVFPKGSFGRVDFPGSNPDDMIISLDTLRSIEVKGLFAGHMEPVLGDHLETEIEKSYKNAKFML